MRALTAAHGRGPIGPQQEATMSYTAHSRSPAFKLGLAIVIGLVLTIPLFSVWLLEG